MYALFTKTIWTSLLLIYGGLVLLTLKVCDYLGVTIPDISILRYLALAIIYILTLWFGSSSYYSGWRMLWRKYPNLNNLFFPDINGVWVGNTQSNWPVIDKLRTAAGNPHETLEDADLDNIQLKQDPMAVEIRASLFSIRLSAKLGTTASDSHSVVAKVTKNDELESLSLAYIYEQTTPSPLSTDQDKHTGAAELSWSGSEPDKLSGVYWTRRSWKKGLNTAGLLILKRVTAKKANNKSLADYL